MSFGTKMHVAQFYTKDIKQILTSAIYSDSEIIVHDAIWAISNYLVTSEELYGHYFNNKIIEKLI